MNGWPIVVLWVVMTMRALGVLVLWHLRCAIWIIILKRGNIVVHAHMHFLSNISPVPPGVGASKDLSHSPPPPSMVMSRKHSELIWFALHCGKAKQCPPPPRLVVPHPLLFPGGGGGGRRLVNPKFFVAAHCVVVWVTVLWGTATCIPCTHGRTFCSLSVKWNLIAQPCFPLGQV